jgi:hypothetical protein
LINYGYTYEAVTLPEMTVSEVETLLTSIFPRKITIQSPDDADDAIPELIAFWRYLKREYQLAQADDILAYLQQTGPEFREEMNNPANFGMAKSFISAGRSAGFDMSTQEGVQAFQQYYNANLARPDPSLASPVDGWDDLLDAPAPMPGSPAFSGDKAKKRKKRKIAKASRKQNRKRKK